MVEVLSFALLLQLVAPSTSRLTLDGGSIYPPRQTVSYRWNCPDGLVTVDITQVHGSPPRLARAVYGGVPIADAIRGQISAAVSRFRTVESISPRCLTGGGIRLLFGGLFRDEYPARKHVVTVKFGRHRRLEIG